MKEHGIQYPTICRWEGVTSNNLASMYSIRNQIGFPTDKIYALGPETHTASDATSLANLARDVNASKALALSYGYQNFYVYGVDEASGNTLLLERPQLQTVHNTGAKTFVAGHNDAADNIGDLLDVFVHAGNAQGTGLSTTQAATWHSLGKKIFSYNNPQVGVENPEIYRKNYGLALWNAGYDGAMDFAYQADGGSFIWNDYDAVATTHNRDHVFAYPTSNGVIDTIQWEGWREGVDDTRYLASLIKKEGNSTSAKTIVSAGISNNENMTAIRKKVIDQILILDP
jgi:hypothetical protein